jgi:hypothetical protein
VVEKLADSLINISQSSSTLDLKEAPHPSAAAYDKKIALYIIPNVTP